MSNPTDHVDSADDSRVTRRWLLRTGTLGVGALGAAVALGGVSGAAQAGDADANAVPAPGWQIGWHFCHLCLGLWWPSSGSYCCGNPQGPSFGPHFKGSNVYQVSYNYDVPSSGFQGGWRYCHKCHLLHYGSGGRCPAGGAHAVGSTNYDAGGRSNSQPGWRYCTQCRGLWWAGSSSYGACPGFNGHLATGSDYRVQSYTSLLGPP